jgi:hypothetical protein
MTLFDKTSYVGRAVAAGGHSPPYQTVWEALGRQVWARKCRGGIETRPYRQRSSGGRASS